MNLDQIAGTEFIGESLATINNNFQTIETDTNQISNKLDSTYTTVQAGSALWGSKTTVIEVESINFDTNTNKADVLFYSNNPGLLYPITIMFAGKTVDTIDSTELFSIKQGSLLTEVVKPNDDTTSYLTSSTWYNFTFLDYGDNWQIAIGGSNIFGEARLTFIGQVSS